MTAIRIPDFSRQVAAVRHVEELLRRTTAALDAAGIPYAVIGGNAVAAWVATVDEGAVRATKDVDVMIRRTDLDAVAEALRPAGLVPAVVLGVTMFLERDRPNPKTGVHIIFAGEPIRPTDPLPAPTLENVHRAGDGFAVLGLSELLVMKLIANRRRDQVHIEDMLELGMITAEQEARLPPLLRQRLERIRQAPE